MTTSPRAHLNAGLAPDARAALLLEQMTLLEKAHQLTSIPVWYLVSSDGTRSPSAAEWNAKAPGSISNFGADDPAAMARIVGGLQRTAIEDTRLGIPLLVHTEALNGFLSGGHMVFPTPTGLAATWSPDLVEEMADVIRVQMKRVGVRQALSPNMDVALDPRWGRVHETYGEDPYLVAALSVAFTRGLQGADLSEGVIATAKHFVGYSLPEGGMNLAAFEGGGRRIRDLFAFPFEAAIQEAGLASVMNAYSDVDGVPAAAAREILTDLLRGTLGFDGFVSSDYSTLEHMVTRQKVASTPAAASRLAIEAGLDTEFPLPYGYGDVLAGEIEAGRVSVRHLDESVTRVLTAKFRLGLFEHPFPAERIEVAEVAAEGRELSAELARRSVTLAANDGILPLPAQELSVAIIGPHADAVSLQFPTYSYPAFRAMTVYMSSGGMGNMVGIDPGMAVWNDSLYSEQSVDDHVRERLGASSLSDAVASFATSVTVVPGSTLTRDLGPDAIAAAVDAAANADVVILALGGASLWFNGERTEGEGSDSSDIALPAAQTRLAEAVAATGTPTVSVLFQGRAYALPQVVLDSSAIVVAPYGGPFGPLAVAEVLFGATAPSGKLPYSIPRHTGQLPVYHHQKAGTGYRNALPPDVDQHYLDGPATPQFAFGHGLSYTSFDLGEVTAEESTDTSGTWSASVAVRNTGDSAGATVVQLYAHVDAFGVTRPAQQLLGFVRVELEAGATREVDFTLDATQFGFSGLDRSFAVEPGRVDYFLGFDSDDRRVSGSFDVTGPRRVLSSSDRTFFARTAVSDPERPAVGSD